MKEQWKNYEYGNITYKVSNFGKIVGPRGRRLKTRYNRDGYEEVTLGDTKHRNASIRVHRLVAALFVPNPDDKPEVNHLDYNRTHNSSDNLEWVTHKENVDYSSSAGHYKSPLRRGAGNGRAILSDKDVVKIIELLSYGVPATHIAHIYGVGDSTIYNIKLGNTWKHISRN